MLKTVKDDIYEMKTKFTAEESEPHVSKTITDNLTKHIETLERNCYENEQYSKWECLKISDIPGSIADISMEKTGLETVEDYHRLKVIMKLSKRKDVYQVVKAKPNLKSVDLNGTGIPPGIPIFVKHPKICADIINFLSKCKILWLNKVVESLCDSKGSCRIRLLDKSIKVMSNKVA